jgi:hypothetical protein
MRATWSGEPWCRLMLTLGYAARSAATFSGSTYRAWVWVVAMDRVPLSSALYCSPMRFRNQFNAPENMLAWLSHAFESFAMAGENLDAQLFLQLNDGLGDARLRCV